MAESIISRSDEIFFNRIGERFTVISHDDSGECKFPGLVKSGQMWLVFAQRITVNNSICVLIHKWYGSTDLHIKEVWKDEGMEIIHNSVGTVEIQYAGKNTNIFACAIRLV